MRAPRIVSLSMTLVITCMASLLSANDWSEALTAQAVRAADISDEGTWILATPSGKGAFKEEELSMWTRPLAAGGWDFGYESKGYKSAMRMDASLRFVSEDQRIFSSELVERYGVDRMTWSFGAKEAVQTFYMGDKAKKPTRVGVDPDTVSDRAFPNQIRALAIAGRTGDLDIKILLGAQKVEGRLSFRRTDDPLAVAASYPYPDSMRKAITKGDYLLADFRLTGVYGLAYPHHFYYAFAAGPRKELLAAWSGKPSEAQYQWRKR
jgi:hypothetical protein